MKRLGYVTVPATRETVTAPSSSGWRSTSSTSLAKLRQLVEKQHAVVRQAYLARPRRAAAAGHGGARHRVVRRAERADAHYGVAPAREPDDGIDLRGSRSFRRGSSRAVCPAGAWRIMDLPAPGGPTIRMLCPPAAATSSARLTFSCPLTSAKSTGKRGVGLELRRRHGLDALVPAQMVHELGHVLDRVHGHARRQRRPRPHYPPERTAPYAARCGGERHRQRAVTGRSSPRGTARRKTRVVLRRLA